MRKGSEATPAVLHDSFTKAWLQEQKKAYRQRGVPLRIAPPNAQELERLCGECEASKALVALLRITNGLKEYHGEDRTGPVECKVLLSAVTILVEWQWPFRTAPKNFLCIGERSVASGARVEFVMEVGAESRRVGVYLPAHRRVQRWCEGGLREWLEGVAAGTVATDAELERIDARDEEAMNIRRRDEREQVAALRKKRRYLPAPARPRDWRGLIERAFEGTEKKVKFRRPLADPHATLLRVCNEPPRVLVDLLLATNGAYDKEGYLWFLHGARDIVSETQETRAQTRKLEKLVVIGCLGVDGILFVMEEGASKNRVGSYDPLGHSVRWVCPTLSDFVNRYAESSVAF